MYQIPIKVEAILMKFDLLYKDMELELYVTINHWPVIDCKINISIIVSDNVNRLCDPFIK